MQQIKTCYTFFLVYKLITVKIFDYLFYRKFVKQCFINIIIYKGLHCTKNKKLHKKKYNNYMYIQTGQNS